MAPHDDSQDAPVALRRVPLSTRAVLYFGNARAQGAWVVLNAALLVFWWVAPMTDMLLGALTSVGRLSSTTGKITDVAVLDGHRNKVSYLVRYAFTDPAGERREGTSYTPHTFLRPGHDATIDFVPADPRRHRVRGFSHAHQDHLLTLLLPFVGLLGVTATLGHGMKAASLLARGRIGLGRLVGREEILDDRGALRGYRLSFRLQGTSDDVAEVEVRDLAKLGALVDEEEEVLFYDPAYPARAFPLDMLPDDVEVDAGGQARPASIAKALASVVLPALTPVIQAAYAVGVLVRFP